MALDIILGIILVFAIFRGWNKGVVDVILSLVMLLLAIYGASLLAGFMGGILGIEPAYMSNIVGFMVSFVLLYFIGRALRERFKPKRGILGVFDKILGAALGLVKGVLVLSLALILMRVIHMPPVSMRESSKLYPMIIDVAPSLVKVLRPMVAFGDKVEV